MHALKRYAISTLRLFKRRSVWPCLLCKAETETAAICKACQPQLPWNKTACLQCATPMPIAGQICGACTRANAKQPPTIQLSLVPLLFKPPVDRLIRDFKYQERLDYGLTLAELLLPVLMEYWQALPEDQRPDAIVPVPLHPKRTRERGYDQALELAKFWAKQLQIPLATGLLIRKKYTPPLAGMQRSAERRNAIKGAFAVDKTPPQHIALVDDVMTTGTTLQECAKVLREAGTEHIEVWAAARTIGGHKRRKP